MSGKAPTALLLSDRFQGAVVLTRPILIEYERTRSSTHRAGFPRHNADTSSHYRVCGVSLWLIGRDDEG
jgi:hypothetical protein